MIAFVIFLGILAALWLALLISPAHRVTFSQRLDVATSLPAPPDPLPAITVIVPARNEAGILPRTIPTICQQDYPNLSVILIDDQSDDDSPNVIAQLQRDHANLHAFRAADRPPGWMGKCWAVQQGVQEAKKAWVVGRGSGVELQNGVNGNSTSNPQPPTHYSLLLFTDADILYHPQAARQAVAYLLDRKLDMLSLLPRCLCVGFLERIGVGGLISILSMLFPLGWANDPNKKWMALAAGGFLLIRPEPYEKIGGHACVRSQMIEDVNLARKLKRADARIECRMTRDLVSTRMYEGFADMWEGLTKNAYAGMEYQPRKFWVGLIVGIAVTVLPPVYLLITLILAMRSHTPMVWSALGLAVLINLCMIMIHSRTVRHLQLPPIDIFFMPLSAAMYDLIALDSFRQHHFGGGNVWKGRRYDRATLLSRTQQEQVL